MLEQYPHDLKVVYKYFVVHPSVATQPALAACAADKQGKFHEMYEALWKQGYDAGRNYSADNIDKIAASVGLDVDKMHADMKGECARAVSTDQREMASLGTTGTPAFYINGRFLSGARPIDQFKALIDQELKKANERTGQGGTTAANYYDTWVVGKGKKKL